MDNIQLAEFVKSLDSELTITEGKQFTEVTVPAAKLHNIALRLREEKAASFDFLFCVSGVDYKQDLGVVYHLRSTIHGHTLVLKVRTSDRTDPN
ncbi:MAG: NADH-quinone oxidoreductase subunit C, partial [Methanosarcina sp.]